MCQSRVLLLSDLSFIINVFSILLSLLSNACSTQMVQTRESTLKVLKFFLVGEGFGTTKKPKYNSKYK